MVIVNEKSPRLSRWTEEDVGKIIRCNSSDERETKDVLISDVELSASSVALLTVKDIRYTDNRGSNFTLILDRANEKSDSDELCEQGDWFFVVKQ